MRVRVWVRGRDVAHRLDVSAHAAAALHQVARRAAQGEARRRRVSSRPVWGLLVWGLLVEGPSLMWHTRRAPGC